MAQQELAFSAQYTDEAERIIKSMGDLQNLFPREVRMSFHRVGATIKRRMIKAATTGKAEDVDWADLSEIRDRLKAGIPLGGKMNTQAKSLIRVYNANGYMQVGYITELHGYVSRFQEGGNIPLTLKARHTLHRRLGALGFRETPVPAIAAQPERPFIEPIARRALPDVQKWVHGNLRKLIAKRLGIKAGVFASSEFPAT